MAPVASKRPQPDPEGQDSVVSGPSCVPNADLVQAAQARGFDADRVSLLAEAAPPLWADVSIEQQVSDLSLLLRPLGPAELRVRVEPPDEGSSEWQVTVVAADRLGLLAITTSLLSSFDLTVTRARVGTWPDGHALQHLWVLPNLATSVEPQWALIGQSLQYSLEHEALRPSGDVVFSADWVSEVRLLSSSGEGTAKLDRFLVVLSTEDRKGVLSAISARFADLGMNVISAEVKTVDGVVRDVFVVDVAGSSSNVAELLAA